MEGEDKYYIPLLEVGIKRVSVLVYQQHRKDGGIMWLLFGIAFGTFAGGLASFDKQSKGIQFITGAILFGNTCAFYILFCEPICCNACNARNS